VDKSQSRTLPSKSPVRSFLPSGLKATPRACLGCCSGLRVSLLSPSQNRITPAPSGIPDSVAKLLPSWLKATAQTISLCSRRRPRGLPVATDQSCAHSPCPWGPTIPISSLPSELKAAVLIQPPSSRFQVSVPLAKSHS